MMISGDILAQGRAASGGIESQLLQGFTLLRNSEPFERQLAALLGDERVDRLQAKQFNEAGLLPGVEASGLAEIQPGADGASSSGTLAKANSDQDAYHREASKRIGHTPLRQSHGVADDGPDATPAQTISRSSAYHAAWSGPGRLSPALLATPQPTISEVQAKPIAPPVAKSALPVAMDIGSAQGSVPDASSPEIFADKAYRRSGMALVQSQSAMFAAGSIRIALQELAGGLRLVAEIPGLKREDKARLRSALLSLLAQHGLGNYELLFDGDAIRNRIVEGGS